MLLSIMPMTALAAAPTLTTESKTQYGTATAPVTENSNDAVAYEASPAGWFTDADGDALSYICSATYDTADGDTAAGDAGISMTTGAVYYTPAASDAGKTVVLSVYASDGSDQSTEPVTVMITVNEPETTAETPAVSALAAETPTISTTSTLQNGVRSQQVKITLTNGKFSENPNPDVQYSPSVGSSGGGGFSRDSDTTATVSLPTTGMCAGTVSIDFNTISSETNEVYSVLDGNDQPAATNTLELTIPGPSGPLALPEITLSAVRPNDDFSQSFAATGGNGVKTYAVTVGSLPPGLRLDNGNSGRIYGKPTTEGDYTFTLSVTDSNIDVANGDATSNPTTVTKEYTISVKEPETTDGYSFMDGTIYGYSGGGDITIPSEINGVPVTALADMAFEGNDDITSVVIPASVKTIGGNVFSYCTGLRKVTFKGPLTSMGTGVFYGAGLTAASIPDGISVLPDSTFCNCASLTDVTIPANITEIDEDAFSGAGSLQHIVIPATVTKIGKEAFAGWDDGYGRLQLDTAIFLGNAPVMGTDVFNNTADGFTVYYPGTASGFVPGGGSGLWHGYDAQQYDPAATYTVTYDSNGTLTSGSAPTAVTGLAMGGTVSALAGAGSMARTGYEFEGWNTAADGSGISYNAGDAYFVTGSVTLYAVWERAYSITIDPSITHGRISANAASALYDSSILVTVTPDSGYRLKAGSLYYTAAVGGQESLGQRHDKYGNLYYSFDMPDEDVVISATFESAGSDYDISADGTIEHYYGTDANLTIPESIGGVDVKEIGDYAFYESGVTSVVIPEGVTVIGEGAFAESAVQSVSLPQTLTTIGGYAFYDALLANVRIPASVTSIGDEAFVANSLAIAVFDGSVPAMPASFGEGVFDRNDNDFQILYHSGNPGFNSLTTNDEDDDDGYYDSAAIEDMNRADLDQLYLNGIIIYAAVDYYDYDEGITKNLYLSTTAIDGSAITWMTDDPDVISNSGAVTRPALGEEDADVTLTAILEDSNSRDYPIVVQALGFTKTRDGSTANNTATLGLVGDFAQSSDDDVAEALVYGGGYGCIGITSVGPGTATITVTDASGHTATIAVTVDAYGSITIGKITKYTAPSDDSGGVRGGATTTTTATPTTTPTTTVSGSMATTTVTPTVTNGTATGSVTADQMSDALKKAQAAAGTNGTPNVTIQINGASGAGSVGTTIPHASMQALVSGGVGALTISGPTGSVSFDTAALKTIVGASGDMTVTVSKADASTLSAAAQALVGSHPVFTFSVTSGGSAVSQFGGNVSVSVPYTPASGEDTNAIVIYYIAADGTPTLVPDARYDAATGTVAFTTTHFSTYAVGYNKVGFTDVASGAWYADAVTFLSARSVTSGTTATTFSPDATLTRGQFITMLLRAYGVAAVTNPADNFTDAGSTYYTGYLAAAKKLGITSGVGGNRFAPDNAITRQEMFTLLYNALKVLDKLPEGASGKTLADFADSGSVASWATDAMTALVKAGTVTGSNGTLNPTGITTRAEMAQVLYNLLGK
jgi:uncharacterized repeat protein (TIGR02543 family)